MRTPGRRARNESPARQARPSDDLLDDCGLGVGIALNRVPFLLGESQFRAGIEGAIGGVRSESVPERENPADFGALGRKNMQIDFCFRAVEHPVFVPAGFSNEQHVAGGLQRGNVGIFVG